MSRPAPSIPYSKLLLVSDALIDFKNAAYKNEAVISLLESEKARLEKEWRETERAKYEYDLEQERIKELAAKEKKEQELAARLEKMSKADKVKAQDILDKLSKLRTGTEIYDEYEIQLNLLFRYYDSI